MTIGHRPDAGYGEASVETVPESEPGPQVRSTENDREQIDRARSAEAIIRLDPVTKQFEGKRSVTALGR